MTVTGDSSTPVEDERGLLTFSELSDIDHVGALVTTIQHLSLARSLPEIQEIVRVAARRLTGADGATFVLREQGFSSYVDAGLPPWDAVRLPLEDCVSGWVMLHRVPAVVEDIYTDERVPHELYRPASVKSLVMVPIRRLEPLGAIGNYWEETHLASDQEVELLQALADSTAIAMENVNAYRHLEEARTETLERLALAAEYRDDNTFHHTERVATTASLLGERLGLAEEFVALLRQAAPLHDLGKLAVSDAILLKPGVLDEDEFEEIRKHPAAGSAILAGSSAPVLQLAEEIARTHHEWWDGQGYPAGLQDTDIPISGRVVALADVFDALTHARPYKDAWEIERARDEIIGLRGSQFDPEVVDAFARLDQAELTRLVG